MSKNNNDWGWIAGIVLVMVVLFAGNALLHLFSGIFQLAFYGFIAYLIYRLFTRKQASRRKIPPHPRASNQASEWGRRVQNQVDHRFENAQSSASHSASGSYAQSAVSGRSASGTHRSRQIQERVHPFYDSALRQLRENTQIIPKRRAAVHKFLDTAFSHSTISVARYEQVIDHAQQVLEQNCAQAEMALEMVDQSRAPDERRRQMVQNYIDNSQAIIDSFEHVVNELICLQQSETLEQGDVLEERLSELAQTTKYYQKH